MNEEVLQSEIVPCGKRPGRGFPEYPVEITMQIKTLCPAKYLLIDRETGDCWRWENSKSTWVRA